MPLPYLKSKQGLGRCKLAPVGRSERSPSPKCFFWQNIQTIFKSAFEHCFADTFSAVKLELNETMYGQVVSKCYGFSQFCRPMDGLRLVLMRYHFSYVGADLRLTSRQPDTSPHRETADTG